MLQITPTSSLTFPRSSAWECLRLISSLLSICRIGLLFPNRFDSAEKLPHIYRMKAEYPLIALVLLATVLAVPAREDPFAVRLGLGSREQPTSSPRSRPRPHEKEEPTSEERQLTIDESFERLQHSLQSIHELVAQREYERAAHMTEAAITTFGEIPPLLHLGARIAMRRRDYEAADAYWEQASQLDLTNEQRVDLYSQWGGTLFLQGDAASAVDILRRGWELQPYRPIDTITLVTAYTALGDHRSASELIRLLDLPELGQMAALLIAKDGPPEEMIGTEGIIWLSRALTADGEPPPATEPLQSTQDGFLSISGAPEAGPDTATSLADAKRQLRALDRLVTRFWELFGENQYEDILILQSRLQETRLRIAAPPLQAAFAYTRLRAGDETGIEELRQLMQEYPENLAVGTRLATAYLEASEYMKAAAVLATLDQRYPQHPLVLMLQACALAEDGRHAEALDTLNAMPALIRPLIATWLSNPKPHHRTILSDERYAGWRSTYLGME